MAKKTKPIPNEVEITYELPEGHAGLSYRIDEKNGIQIIDSAGQIIPPQTSTRLVTYKGQNRRKTRNLSHTQNSYISIGGLKELSEFDSVFFIDTNTETIKDERISIAFIIRIKFIHTSKEEYEAHAVDRHAFIFDFRNVPSHENPEMLAILKLSNDLQKELNSDSRICIVTDSNLSAHRDISYQKLPIYGHHYLDPRFAIFHASDKGGDAVNQLIRICDREAGRVMEKMKMGAFSSKHLLPLKEEEKVLCSCHPLPIEQFEMKGLKESRGIISVIKFN